MSEPTSGTSMGAARIVVGFMTTAACALLAMRFVDWPRTLAALGRVSAPSLLGFIVLNTLSIVVFAARWRRLVAGERPPPLRWSFDILSIGLLANAVLPARPGDVIRAALLKRRGISRFSAGVASIVLERFIDVVFVCALGFALSLAMGLPSPVERALQLFAAGAAVLLVALALLGRHADLVDRLAERVRRLPTGGSLARMALIKLGEFAAALGVLRGRRDVGTVILLTGVAWGSLLLGVMMLLEGFHMGVPMAAAILVVVTTNLGAAVPSSPGSIGVYHFLAVLALSAWNVDPALAMAFAVVTHFLSVMVHVACGLTGAWHQGVKVARLRALAAND